MSGVDIILWHFDLSAKGIFSKLIDQLGYLEKRVKSFSSFLIGLMK